MKNYKFEVYWKESEVFASGSILKEFDFIPPIGTEMLLIDDSESIICSHTKGGEKNEKTNMIHGKVIRIQYAEDCGGWFDHNGDEIMVPFQIELEPDE